MDKLYTTKSREETIKLGEKFANGFKPGDIIALIGELGSGKTTLVKGIAKGLGVKSYRYVNSPSFVIIKEYKGKISLYHFDIFRLNAAKDLDGLGYEGYFYGDGICVIEWADKIKKLLPKKYIEVKIKIIGENRREIIVCSRGSKG